jgi:hypothetical protein
MFVQQVSVQVYMSPMLWQVDVGDYIETFLLANEPHRGGVLVARSIHPLCALTKCLGATWKGIRGYREGVTYTHIYIYIYVHISTNLHIHIYIYVHIYIERERAMPLSSTWSL